MLFVTLGYVLSISFWARPLIARGHCEWELTALVSSLEIYLDARRKLGRGAKEVNRIVPVAKSRSGMNISTSFGRVTTFTRSVVCSWSW